MAKDSIKGISFSHNPVVNRFRLGKQKLTSAWRHRSVQSAASEKHLHAGARGQIDHARKASALRLFRKLLPARLHLFLPSSVHSPEYPVIPAINDCPFNDFWEEVKTDRNYLDTVQHHILEVRAEQRKTRALAGRWHVKAPGRESSPERLKRYLQKIIYRITGKSYKAYFYNDLQLLAQREVMASNVYKMVMLAGKSQPVGFNDLYRVHYSYDDSTDSHCITSSDLTGFRPGSELFTAASAKPLRTRFDPDLNPVTNLVIRRFLLGDEDYLKLDNYMFDGDRLCNIDFGMACYNKFSLPPGCSMDQFKQRVFTPSAKHRLQYWKKNTIMSVIRRMDSEAVDRGIRNALEKIASLTDEQLRGVVGHVYQEDVANAMLVILRFKRDQARALLGQGDWPEELGRGISDSLAGRFHRT
ncbi:MAG: hypothetical protein ACR2PT_14005 [Endozoicomonas sp.]